jgi:hypothetical protein
MSEAPESTKYHFDVQFLLARQNDAFRAFWKPLMRFTKIQDDDEPVAGKYPEMCCVLTISNCRTLGSFPLGDLLQQKSLAPSRAIADR